MKLTVLGVSPPTRRGRPPVVPRPGPVAALRAVQPRVRLTPPPTVRAPQGPPQRLRARRIAPWAPVVLPPPVLRLVVPPVPVPVRFALKAPVPVPLAPPVEAVPIATSVGIAGTTGTQVTMTPADLTQPGRVDITQFHVALYAGVW